MTKPASLCVLADGGKQYESSECACGVAAPRWWLKSGVAGLAVLLLGAGIWLAVRPRVAFIPPEVIELPLVTPPPEVPPEPVPAPPPNDPAPPRVPLTYARVAVKFEGQKGLPITRDRKFHLKAGAVQKLKPGTYRILYRCPGKVRGKARYKGLTLIVPNTAPAMEVPWPCR